MKLFNPPQDKNSLLGYLLKYKPQFVISSVCGIIYNTVIVLGPILMGNLIDAAGGGVGQKVVLSGLYFVGVTAFFQFARFVKRWFMRDQFNRVACDLRQTFLEQMLGKTLPELEKETIGDLMSRTVGDITMVVDTVMSTLNEGWDTWLLMVSYFTVLMLKDWKLTLIASFMVPITILLAQRMRHLLYQYSMQARRAASASSSGLQRYLDAVAVLRLFGRESSESEEILASFKKQADFNIKEMLLQQALLPIYSLIAGLGIVIVIAMGGSKVLSGDWTIGTFDAFLVMFIAFSGRTRMAARVFNRWHGAQAAWSRIKEKLNSSAEVNFTVSAEKKACSELIVENLCFGFQGTEVLHSVSFTAKKGQLIGITGTVGSGKTALAHAITGLYPYQGSITLDGMELSHINIEERNRYLAYTGHEQFLFSMSIRENILFSEENEKSLQQALKAAALTDDMARFDNGLATLVGEKGMRVSGGQRQRIALARALATEAEIIDRLKLDYSDRIILLFTHRLTAFLHADNILVLDQGNVIQSGTHTSLMQKKGLYHEIYSAQIFMEVSADAEIN